MLKNYMKTDYISLLGAGFLIWQLGAIWRFKNLELAQMIKIDDLDLYRWNMWLGTGFFLVIVILKYTMQINSLTTNMAILTFVFAVQVAFCFYIIKYKGVMRDFNVIANLRNSGQEQEGRRILVNLYGRMHRILLLLLKSYLNNNAYVDRKTKNKALIYEESTITYLVTRFEDLIRDFGLTGNYTITRDRQALENQIRSSKL